MLFTYSHNKNVIVETRKPLTPRSPLQTTIVSPVFDGIRNFHFLRASKSQCASCGH
jgi:hypothetical protein